MLSSRHAAPTSAVTSTTTLTFPGAYDWFAANTADVGGELLFLSFTDSIWAARLMDALHSIAWPLAIWFKPACVCLALSWYVLIPSSPCDRCALGRGERNGGVSPPGHAGLQGFRRRAHTDRLCR